MKNAAADAIARLRQASRAIARLEPQIEEARTELHRAMRDCASAGMTPTDIARLANVSRQRVSQVLHRK